MMVWRLGMLLLVMLGVPVWSSAEDRPDDGVQSRSTVWSVYDRHGTMIMECFLDSSRCRVGDRFESMMDCHDRMQRILRELLIFPITEKPEHYDEVITECVVRKGGQ